MARSDTGWFAVPREIMSSDKSKNIFASKKREREIYILLLSWARYKPSTTLLGRQKVSLQRGELVTSYAELQAETDFTLQSVRTCVKNLEKWQKINIVSNTLGLHLSVCNYDEIRESFFQSNMEPNTDLTGFQQGPNRDLTGFQQHKKKEEEKTEEGNELIFPESPPASDNRQAIIPEVLDPEPTNALQLTTDTASERKAKEKKLVNGLKVAKTAGVWDAYRTAYAARYGTEPLDNAKIRSQAAKLIDYIGAEDAPYVARWYVEVERGKNGWLTEKRHPFDELLKSHQNYWTAWKVQFRITSNQAQTSERNEANDQVIENYLRQKKVEGMEGHAQ